VDDIAETSGLLWKGIAMNRKKVCAWALFAGSAVLILMALTVLRDLCFSHTLPNQKLVRLLYEIDHQELLAACRELSLRVTTGEVRPGTYWVRRKRQPRLSEPPPIILQINPLHVRIDGEGYVALEIGGIPYCGLVAYPRDTKEGFSFQGDIELIPGLWYYDEEYNDTQPEYQKEIDALIQKWKMGEVPAE